MDNKILVLGATGTVGAFLVQELVRRGEKVKAASRRGAPVSGAESVVFDFRSPETFEPALENANRLYVSSPTGELDAAGLLKPFLDAAIKKGVKIVVHTAIGVDSDDAIPLRQVELQIERSGVPYVILRPNWFTDNFGTYWLSAIRDNDILELPAADGKTSFITASDIALAAAAALTSDAFDGRALVLTGDEALSYGEAATLLSNALGRTIRYVVGDEAALIEYMKQNGVGEDYARLLSTIFYPVAQGWVAEVSPHFREVTGRSAMKVAEYIEQNASRWHR
jgi:uncharacterized protein YbjT (DUF2867 family)